ncbi:MAG: hypothetical protein LBU00_03955 [Treponema sp.]|jgi:phenylalanyl-tRNA synthetase alpha subunit|nr:hypothetical protein [Treponema sp.]
MMMTAEEAAAAAKGLTFEKVWMLMQETDRQIKEMSKAADRRQAEVTEQIKRFSEESKREQAETARQIKELSKETDKQIRELSKETDKQIKELSKETGVQIKELSQNIGGLNNSFGKWAEEMISAKLWEKFKALSYTFEHGGPEKYWEDDRLVAQVDMLLENGDYAMPVEIKSVLRIEHVKEHLKRIVKVRGQLDKRGDRRKLVGAVAGMVVSDNVRKYAQERGLYVLVQSGDSVAVADVPEDFKAQEW